MYIELTESMFVQWFRDMDREESFSVEGRRALFEYLTEEEEGKGQEFDGVSICCEYREDTLEAFIRDYDAIASLGDLELWTQVIPVPEVGTYIIRQF